MSLPTRVVPDASEFVLDEMGVEVALDRVLESAKELTGARYAALCVLNDARDGLAVFLPSSGGPAWRHMASSACWVAAGCGAQPAGAGGAAAARYSARPSQPAAGRFQPSVSYQRPDDRSTWGQLEITKGAHGARLVRLGCCQSVPCRLLSEYASSTSLTICQ